MTTISDPDVPVVAADLWRRRVVLFSAIPVVGLGFALARLTTVLWGACAWVPVLLYYWGSLVLLTAWGGGPESMRRWLQPSRTGRWIWIWRVLALAIPALFLPTGFLPGLASMTGWWVVVSWFGLGALNAWIEEGYWRGLLMDAAPGWPGWLAGFYSAVCFGAIHPLLFGWQGDAWKGIVAFGGTMIAGAIWGLVYRQTRSLRLPIFGHFLQQMLAPPYSVFIQLLILIQR